MKRSILAASVALAMAAEAATSTGAGEAKVKFADKEYDLDTLSVFINFGNGKALSLDLNTLSPEIKNRLMIHGALQKIGDSYAGAKGNYGEAIESAQGVIDQLTAGQWKADREGLERPRLAELAAAIARIKDAPLDKATAAVEKASDDQRKAWRSNAKIKAVIAQMRAEKAAKELEAAGAEPEVAIDLG